jgi:hypothetical protein
MFNAIEWGALRDEKQFNDCQSERRKNFVLEARAKWLCQFFRNN